MIFKSIPEKSLFILPPIHVDQQVVGDASQMLNEPYVLIVQKMCLMLLGITENPQKIQFFWKENKGGQPRELLCYR